MVSGGIARRRRGLASAVRDEIRARIEAGSWRPGHRLPPEPALASSLGVSRSTLREGLKLLSEDGWLSRAPGSGTYVTYRPRLRNDLVENFGVSEMIESMGMQPGTDSLHVYDGVASPPEAEKLGLAEGAYVKIVERVRTADGTPVIFSRDLVPPALLGGRADVLDRLGQGTLYTLLESELGVVVTRGLASIKPAKADRWLASQLGVPTGTLLLYLAQVDYDESGRAVLMSHEHHLADAFEITVARRGPGPTL
jgi:GntR family transcriptional regulator